MKRKVAFKTLGCRLNQYETDSLVTDFDKAGYEIVGMDEQADVYVVNTCTVTNQSDQKSKYSINKAVRSSQKNALVIVTGCMVTSQRDYLENRSDITYVVDNKSKSSVLSLANAHFRGEIIHPADLKQNLFDFSLVEKGFHTRSAIKIQDGCDNFCTYCIVPKVRGRAVSRPVKDVLDNVRRSIDLGNKEIVLTGVNISRYNFEGVAFDSLLERILEVPGEFRVRISSMEPEGITDKFIGLFEHPKLCPHLHLCLQSGSEKVLLRMRRFYTLNQYREVISGIRSRYPDFNFTTDIIVGFPGETESEFNETREVVRQIGFSHIHTFKYSKRSGTRADRMKEHVPEKVKTYRSRLIRELADDMKLSFRKQFTGKEQTLLTEGHAAPGTAKGYGEHFIPIQIKNTTLEKNSFCKVVIKKVLDDKEKTVIGDLK